MVTCGTCGQERIAFETCPFCGASSAPQEPDERGPSDREKSANVPAWEDPEAAFPGNLHQTWRRSVLEPGAFFAGLRFDRSVARPILYYLIISILGAGLLLTWGTILSASSSGFMGQLYELLDPSGVSAVPGPMRSTLLLVNFFLTPFLAVFYLVLWSMLLHFFILILGRQAGPLRATVRAVCYASGPGLFGVVPFVGGLLAYVWVAVLTVIGLREAHGMSTGKALAAFLLAATIAVALLAFTVILIITRGAAGA